MVWGLDVPQIHWQHKPFDRAHIGLRLPIQLKWKLYVDLALFSDIAIYPSKVAKFNVPHLRLAAPYRGDPFRISQQKKTRVWAIVWQYLRNLTFSRYNTGV